MRTRSVKIAVVCTLVGSVLAPLVGQLAAASPTPVAGPPSSPPGPPSSPPGQQADQGIELVDGLGNGGQPEDLPRELVIADARFLFDRFVPLSRQELFRVAQEQETIAYARTEEGPFAAIYLSVPNRSEDELARYLPEGVGSNGVACPAEAGEYERVDAGSFFYAFAGVETDLAADSLQQVGDNNGEPVFADPDSAEPFPELFFSSGGELLRFVLVGGDGRPASIAESLAFNGAEFAFDSDVTDAVDPASLTKVGCSTAFPVFAPTDTAGGDVQPALRACRNALAELHRRRTRPHRGDHPAHDHDIDDHHDHDNASHRRRQRHRPRPTRRRPSRRRPSRRRRPSTTNNDNGAADDHVDVDDNNDNGAADDHIDLDDNNDNGTADDDLVHDHHHHRHDGGVDDTNRPRRPRRARRQRNRRRPPRRRPPPRPPARRHRRSRRAAATPASSTPRGSRSTCRPRSSSVASPMSLSALRRPRTSAH